MELTNIVNEYLRSIKHSIKLKTYLFYLRLNELYISQFSHSLCSKNLNQFMENLAQSLSFSTSGLVKSLMNRSLRFAFENNLLSENISTTIKLKAKTIRKVEALERNEQLKLENYIISNKKYYHYGILIALYTGLRLGELLALKWDNIDFKNRIIYISKTVSVVLENHKTKKIESEPKTLSSIREIPISKQVAILLKDLKNQLKGEYIIASFKGQQILPRTYQNSFSNLLRKLKIKHYGFHSLRHTFATRLIDNKIDVKTISELMGHSNPTITLNRYVHTNIDNKRKALNTLSKLSNYFST